MITPVHEYRSFLLYTRLPIIREHELVRKLHKIVSKTESVVAGGFARYISVEDACEASDIDIFSFSVDSYNDTVRVFDMIAERLDNSPFALNYIWEGKKVQVIVPHCLLGENPINENVKNTSQLLSQFDFTVCQFFLAPLGDEVLATREAVSDQKTKSIVFTEQGTSNRSQFELLIRIGKYSSKGYRISEEESKKLFSMWDQQKIKPVATKGYSSYQIDLLPF